MLAGLSLGMKLLPQRKRDAATDAVDPPK